MQYQDNFLTYVKWRGDLLVKDYPFNEVDAFFDVFVQAGIHDFTEIADMDVKTAGALLKAVTKVPQEHRDRIGKLIKLLIEESTRK